MTDLDLQRDRADQPDTPREAYRRLPPSMAAGVVVPILLVSAAGWAYSIREADRMSSMVMGLGQVGHRMAMIMSVSSFLAMWAGMMVAMMLPTLLPVALAHRTAARAQGQGPAPTAAFAVAFLLVWAATGLVAYPAYRLILEISPSAGDSRWLPTLTGAVLIGVGAFQFAPWKTRCLRLCRRPMAAVGHGGADPGITGSFRSGLTHGWRCLGCCWALMAVFLVVGVMNLAWMVLVAAVFFIDKHWARGEGFCRVVGAGLVVLGAAVVAVPDVLGYVSGVDPNAPLMTDDMGGMKM